jgi:hypothetical protein
MPSFQFYAPSPGNVVIRNKPVQLFAATLCSGRTVYDCPVGTQSQRNKEQITWILKLQSEVKTEEKLTNGTK